MEKAALDALDRRTDLVLDLWSVRCLRCPRDSWTQRSFPEVWLEMTSWCHRHVGSRGAKTLLEGPGESEREKEQPPHTPGVPGWAEEEEPPQGLRTSKGEAGESGVLG